jgi:hypothetical protein
VQRKICQASFDELAVFWIGSRPQRRLVLTPLALLPFSQTKVGVAPNSATDIRNEARLDAVRHGPERKSGLGRYL